MPLLGGEGIYLKQSINTRNRFFDLIVCQDDSCFLICSRPIIYSHYSFKNCSQIPNYRPQTKFAKVMFLHVRVCPQGGMPALGGVCSWGVCSRGGACSGGGACSRGEWRPPSPLNGYCCGWYASYWNAFLLGK